MASPASDMTLLSMPSWYITIKLIATESGTVSATADPAFSFQFTDVVKIGETYTKA